MAILIRYRPSGLTRENYDKVNEILASGGAAEPPAELKLHVLFGDDGNLLISEIWESEDAWRGMFDGPLGAAIKEVGIEMDGEPQQLPVHEFWGSDLKQS
ncbi:MAG: hypothetical protein QOJ29_5052 [Thermoleophilaceae bacterium]|jgi:hypothetical protein|nr:hypothetical protein [Thermoleophilaceae bacterium]